MSDFENFGQLSLARRSLRDLSPDLVPMEVLEKVFEAASYAPSNCNTQPWKVCVVRGDAAAAMKTALLETIGRQDFQLDFPFDDSLYLGEYKTAAARENCILKLPG